MKIKDLHRLFLNSTGVSTDTRSIKSGTIFFALKGDNFNANKFAADAIELGALFSVVDEEPEIENDKLIVVNNVLETLQDLAHFHRKFLDIPIIAITGSNGKTTSKELISSVLSEQFTVFATIGNFNNHIGVPLTLLEMNNSTNIGVVEMGANHIGEIRKLCEIAAPDYGYITNFGKAHLEGFGSLEGVIMGKSELYDYLISNSGLVFINADDSKQLKQIKDYNNIFKFSKSKNSDLEISMQSKTPFVKINFLDQQIQSQLIGAYNFSNIAVAISIGHYFELDFLKIKKGIESYQSKNNRSQIIKQKSNTIILDAYNANPTSMNAALDNFSLMKGDNKIVILGDMFELGDESFNEHKAVIDLVNSLNFSSAYYVGQHFIKHKFLSERVFFFEDTDVLKRYFQSLLISNSVILVKGSRRMSLEVLLKYL
jgi:UDP-N-acetylmuramoyl-tripeptide--D-alanyl-D-alanine ligase